MNVKKICAYAVATFLILTVAFRLVAGEGFESGTVTSQMVREKAVTPEILTNTVNLPFWARIMGRTLTMSCG